MKFRLFNACQVRSFRTCLVPEMEEGSRRATSSHDCVPVEPVLYLEISLHMEQVPSESGLADIDCSLVGLNSNWKISGRSKQWMSL